MLRLPFSHQNLFSDSYVHHMCNDTVTLVPFPMITAFSFNFCTVLGVAS